MAKAKTGPVEVVALSPTIATEPDGKKHHLQTGDQVKLPLATCTDLFIAGKALPTEDAELEDGQVVRTNAAMIEAAKGEAANRKREAAAARRGA